MGRRQPVYSTNEYYLVFTLYDTNVNLNYNKKDLQ